MEQIVECGDRAPGSSTLPERWWHLMIYTVSGLLFGIVLVKGEIISWFRIQEMFRFQAFHMFGVIGTAVVTGIVSVALLKRWKARTLNGEPVQIPQRAFQKGQVYGGLLFGIGWAFTGACPGPLYAQIGSGHLSVLVTLASALVGTWVSGRLNGRFR
ncbi:MAG: DUF6691 family protein [Bacteroidota bacterium]